MKTLLMTTPERSEFEPVGLKTVRPYPIVGDANAAIAFYIAAFDATEIERHDKPDGGVGHVKLRIGDAILEIGEHRDAAHRARTEIPSIGLRLYLTDVRDVYARARAAGGTGEPPGERLPGVRSATVHDPFGMTWWLAQPLTV